MGDTLTLFRLVLVRMQRINELRPSDSIELAIMYLEKAMEHFVKYRQDLKG
jgi:hypothetical protein